MDSTGEQQPIYIADVEGLQTLLNEKATDSDVVHKTGNETIGGAKTFSRPVSPAAPTNDNHAMRWRDSMPLITEAWGATRAVLHNAPLNMHFGNVQRNDGGSAVVEVDQKTSGETVFRTRRPGVWLVQAGLRWAWHGNTADERRIAITNHGLVQAAQNVNTTVADTFISKTLMMDGSGNVRIQAFHFTGGWLDVQGGFNQCWVQLTWLRDLNI